MRIIMSRHLKEINMNYLKHMKCALGHSKESGKAMLYLAIHAFFPDVFVHHGSNKIKKIINQMNSIKKDNKR